MLDFLISIIPPIIGGAILGAIGTQLTNRRKKREEKRFIHEILNFGDDEIIIAFEHTGYDKSNMIIPPAHTEDFLAINSIINVLTELGYRKRIHLLPSDQILNNLHRKQKNLIIIGSGLRNELTISLKQELQQKNVPFYQAQIKNSKKVIIDHKSANYETDVDKQFVQYENTDKEFLGEKSFNDIAAFTKVANPWKRTNKVYLIAGVYGIGTWGAAEKLMDWTKTVYNDLPDNQKNRDFSALLEVHYQGYDIQDVEVYNRNHIIYP